MSAALAALKPFLAVRPAAPGERCGVCATPLLGGHHHLVELETRRLLCACRACHLLFTPAGAGHGRYRAVPDRPAVDPGVRLSEAEWEQLQIPVRLAFLFFNSALGRHVAFYPGPAGATESLLAVEAWRELLERHPALAAAEPDVEALLVMGRRGQAGLSCLLVPIHHCYELVGRVRLLWKGLAGGEAVWDAVEELFDGLQAGGARAPEVEPWTT